MMEFNTLFILLLDTNNSCSVYETLVYCQCLMSKQNKKLLQELIDKHTGVTVITVQDPNTGEYVNARVRIIDHIDWTEQPKYKSTANTKLKTLIEKAKDLAGESAEVVISGDIRDPVVQIHDRKAFSKLKEVFGGVLKL